MILVAYETVCGREALRVVTVERPGYDAHASTAIGFDGNAAALAALVDRLSPDAPVLLLGVSWGGGVAIAYSVANPHRVRGLLLAASVGAPQAIQPIDRLMARGVPGHVAARVLPALSGLLEFSSGSRLTPADRWLTRRGERSWRQRGGWESFRVEQAALVRQTPALWASLRPPDYPVTVVHGVRDRYVPVLAGQALAARLQARYVEVSAGHLLALETPALLAEELVQLATGSAPAGARDDGA